MFSTLCYLFFIKANSLLLKDLIFSLKLMTKIAFYKNIIYIKNNYDRNNYFKNFAMNEIKLLLK